METINKFGPILRRNKDGDYPEDFELENGNYLNKCYKCDGYFMGYKRRVICKCCFNKKMEIKEEYQGLLKSGMFWEFYPQLSGNYEVDEEQWKMIYYNLTIRRKIPSVPKEERYKSNVV